MSLKELKKEYLEFLENISDYLRKAKVILNKDCLDYSYEEIETYIKIYYNNYKNSERIGLTYKELSNILYAYFGTAFVNYNGGKWELNDVKTDEAYGTPTIVNWGGKEYPWIRISPYVWKVIIERNGRLTRPVHVVFSKA